MSRDRLQCRQGARCPRPQERGGGAASGAPTDPYRLTLWRRLGGFLVYIVDGLVVRNEIDIDYVAGGHGYVYDYIPQNEVWIERDVEPVERPYVLLHELVEIRHMRDYLWKYDRAHEEANRVEAIARTSPARLEKMLQEAATALNRYQGRNYVEERRGGGRGRR